jgi:pSer/pThr/pTyr-binding forkhead associated (FHA) protein
MMDPSYSLSSLSDVRSTMMAELTAANAHTWFLKTLRVITSPQRHFAKILLNSASESPPRAQESSLRSRSNTVSGRLAGLSYVGIEDVKRVGTPTSFVRKQRTILQWRQPLTSRQVLRSRGGRTHWSWCFNSCKL